MRAFVYYFVSIILSCCLGLALISGKFILFLIYLIIMITFTTRINSNFVFKISVFILSFLSLINILNYYHVKESKFYNKEFRVVKKFYNDDILVSSESFRHRRYLIKNFNGFSDIEVGMELNLDGEILNRKYYDIGVVGEIVDYNLNKIEKDIYFSIHNIKSIIKDKFSNEFGEERSGILLGLILGDTSYLDKDYKNDLKQLGIIHILSVSGFHINLIFIVLSKILSFIPSIILTFFYLLFTGIKVSGVRAFTMLSLKEFAPRFYKTYDGINALGFAGSIILLFRPYDLYNLGFIYSFAATLGILCFSSKIKKCFYKLPNILAESLAITLSAQIFIFPLIILVDKKLEFGFLVSNIFMVPFYSILMILGVIFIFICFIPIINKILSYVITMIFDIIDGGLILIRSLVPDGIYLMSALIVFILCIYGLYFLMNRHSYKKVKNISILLFCIYLISLFSIDIKIEIGNYYGKNYVIFRDDSKSFLYLNGSVKNTDYLEDKLGVDKIFNYVNGEEIFFYDRNFNLNFDDNSLKIYNNGKVIKMNYYKNEHEYYSNIYPQKYYIMF